MRSITYRKMIETRRFVLRIPVTDQLQSVREERFPTRRGNDMSFHVLRLLHLAHR
ncbi:hypothetical protein P3T18_000977 [Paraburkholderia sp. GAS199]